MTPALVAHRDAAFGAPENTCPALEQTQATGASATDGAGPIQSLSSAEIDALGAGHGCAPVDEASQAADFQRLINLGADDIHRVNFYITTRLQRIHV